MKDCFLKSENRTLNSEQRLSENRVGLSDFGVGLKSMKFWDSFEVVIDIHKT